MKLAAISYTKLRNSMGMVGISIHDRKARVRYARRWHNIAEVKDIPSDIADIYGRTRWNTTYIEQESGEHIIKAIKRQGVPTRIITTQKQHKEPRKLEGIKTMDKVEMTEFLSVLIRSNYVLFPLDARGEIADLEAQVPIWSRHATEAGSIDYYAPGEEPDDLVRALMICCFAVRNRIGPNADKPSFVGGIIRNKRTLDLADPANTEVEIEAQMRAAFPNSYY